ncbi:DUF914-domain-containing protein [Mycena filopes]|nr:DUF914-domain-containing protein [Mycena filopes]
MDSSSDNKVPIPAEGDLSSLYNEQQQQPTEQRPPIEYTSFCGPVRFTLSLLAGQLVSLCITCTNVSTTELVNRNWALPTTQSLFLYFALFIVYTPYTMYKCTLPYGFVGWAKMVGRDGWKCTCALPSFDPKVFLQLAQAYQYTDLLSCMLLDAWAIPVCMFFSYLYMKPKYHWTQILGVLICVAGLGLLVGSDELTQKDWTAAARGKGDAFMEFFVRKRPLYEVVGQLGMFGFIICGAQAAGLEHAGMKTASWNGATVGLLLAYTAAMFILYTVAPLLYRMASSAYYNLSLLSSDWYGLIIVAPFGFIPSCLGLGLYVCRGFRDRMLHYSPYWLYFVAFALVLVGLITYFWHSTPEEQGELNPQVPAYLKRTETETSV